MSSIKIIKVTKSTNLSSNESSRIKILVKETLYNSLAQAFIKLNDTQYWSLKVILFIFVLIASGLCSYLIIQLILSYYKYGVSTTAKTLYETPALFPKVTICNVNTFTTEFAVEFLRNVNREFNRTVDIFDEKNELKTLDKIIRAL